MGGGGDKARESEEGAEKKEKGKQEEGVEGSKGKVEPTLENKGNFP